MSEGGSVKRSQDYTGSGIDTIPDMRLPSPLTENEREIAEEKFKKVAGIDLSGSMLTHTHDVADAGKWGNLVLAAYDALALRCLMAEAALVKAAGHVEDGKLLIAKEAAKGKVLAGPNVLVMFERWERDYVDEILPLLREAGGPAPDEGRYVQVEELRAKRIGARRARERIGREGYGGPR
jgi:hypothetical protein